MTLTEKHMETMAEAPFVIARYPGLSQELCRRGLMRWTDGAWRLTSAGEEALAGHRAARAA